MAKKGDKFIVEISDVFQNDTGFRLYRAKGFNSLVFDDKGINKLQKFNAAAIQEEAYAAGMRDAWEAARKIECSIPIKDIVGLFQTDMPGEIYENFTPRDAMTKIAEYEEARENRVSVGDIVKNRKTGEKGIVILVKKDTSGWMGDRFVTYIMTDGNVYITSAPDESLDEDFEKIGERCDDIVALKASIGGFPLGF